LTKEELERHGLKLGPAMTLVDFAKEIKEKVIKGKEQGKYHDCIKPILLS